MIIGCRRDTQELFAIEVVENRVTRRLLMQGDFSYDTHAALPYQESIDRWEVDRWRGLRNPRKVLGPT